MVILAVIVCWQLLAMESLMLLITDIGSGVGVMIVDVRI